MKLLDTSLPLDVFQMKLHPVTKSTDNIKRDALKIIFFIIAHRQKYKNSFASHYPKFTKDSHKTRQELVSK